MKELAPRLVEDLRHAAVMFSHHQAAASTTRPAAAGLAVTLAYGQPTRKHAARRRRGGRLRRTRLNELSSFITFFGCYFSICMLPDDATER